MRSIDDQLAALFDDSSELVTRFATDPKLIVVLVQERHHLFVLASRVLDVDLAADFGGAPKRLAKVAGE